MGTMRFFGTGLIAGDMKLPTPDNNNWPLMDEGETPAEFLRWVHQEIQRLNRELAADERLLTCPRHRRTRQIREAMEKCCLWHFYGVR
jgi:hypothetical protein